MEESGETGKFQPASGRPRVIIPLFSRCALTCPVALEALSAALPEGQRRFGVAALSFDPQDTATDLAGLRKAHSLPPQWRLMRGQDAAATRAFLDLLGFQVMTAKGGFDHPDTLFVLSPGGVWAGTLFSPPYTDKDLDRAYKAAMSADAPSLRQRLMRPESWLIVACAAFVLCLSAVFVLAGRR